MLLSLINYFLFQLLYYYPPCCAVLIAIGVLVFLFSSHHGFDTFFNFTSAPGLKNKRPVVKTVSPTFKPVKTCTLELSLIPVVISAGIDLPPLYKYTNFFLPSGCTTIVGIMIAFSFWPNTIFTLAKTPGIKAASPFFTIPLIARLLVFSSILTSDAMIFAE